MLESVYQAEHGTQPLVYFWRGGAARTVRLN